MCRLIPGSMCPHASYLKESRLTLFKLSQSLRWCHFFTSLQLCVKAYNFLEITLYIFYYGRRFCKCIKSINIQTALLSVMGRHLSGLLHIKMTAGLHTQHQPVCNIHRSVGEPLDCVPCTCTGQRSYRNINHSRKAKIHIFKQKYFFLSFLISGTISPFNSWTGSFDFVYSFPVDWQDNRRPHMVRGAPCDLSAIVLTKRTLISQIELHLYCISGRWTVK